MLPRRHSQRRTTGGADYAINYTKEDWQSKVKDLTDGTGVDIVYGGATATWERTRCVARH